MNKKTKQKNNLNTKTITRQSRWIIGIVFVCVIAVAGYFIATRSPQTPKIPAYVLPPLTTPYHNNAHNFSLQMPEGFSVREASMDGVDTIVLERSGAGHAGLPEGIQIVVSPFDETKTIDVPMILESVPDMVITDDQVVEVGEEHRGVAFKSDSLDFDGASREVWFPFRGKLYQISTYDRLDPLLQAMFTTWKFE